MREWENMSKLQQLERDNNYLNLIYLRMSEPGNSPYVDYYLEVENELWELRGLGGAPNKIEKLKGILNEIWDLLTLDQQMYIRGEIHVW